MVISAELEQSLYSADALTQATASYQSSSTANAINSEWYYNLGMNQAFNGKVLTTFIRAIDAGETGLTALSVLCGVQQIDGVAIKTLFTTDGTASGQLVGSDGAYAELMTDDGTPVTPEIYVENYQSYQYARYQSVYAQQAGLIDKTNTAPVQEPFLMNVAHWDETEEKYMCVEEEFVAIERASDATDAPFVAVKADGTKVYLINSCPSSFGWNMPVIKKTTAYGEEPVNAFGNNPTLSSQTHKLDNDDTDFIPFDWSNESPASIAEEAMANWSAMQAKGFDTSIFLYH